MIDNHIETIIIDTLIDSPYQGRLIDKDTKSSLPVKQRLKELANSINSSGLLHPISVRKVGENYEIIDGHRRVEAHKLLGIKTIQSIITAKSDREVQIMSVVANLQRTNLNNIEKAISFQKILKAKVFKTRKELSKAIGKDETYVGDILNLLNLDKRIIGDILKFNTTNDVRLLRLIRKSENVDTEGKSDIQFGVYQKFKKEKLSRQEVLNLIKETEEGSNKAFTISGNSKKISLVLREKLTKQQQELFKEILERKILESMDELKATEIKPI